MNEELTTVRAVLGALRSKIRAAWTLRGAGWIVAAVCSAALFSFLLDWFLDLPLAVRAVHLVVALGAVYAVAHWSLVRPLATPMSEQDLAQAIEHGAPDLHDRLVSALDFEKRLDARDDPESRELMAGVVRDAAVQASRLDPGLLVDARPARRALAVAAAAVTVLGCFAVTMHDDFALWLQRGLLLSEIPWPRRTHVHAKDFPQDGHRVITRGDDLRLIAVAQGDLPAEIVLHYEELTDPDPDKADEASRVAFTDVRHMYPVEGEEGHYAFDFHAVSASFRFWLTGGDDQDDEPLYTVTALAPPRVARIAGRVKYPAYASLPEADIAESSFEVLKDSHVDLTITTNMPVVSARIVPTDANTATAVPVGADGRTLTLSFDVDQPIDFHLELTAAKGQTNRADDDVFHLRAVEDRPPDLRVLYPPARLYRTPAGVVPLKVVARDDFRVAKITLELALGTAPIGSAVIWPPAETVPAPAPAAGPARRVDAYRPLDLLALGTPGTQKLKPGDVLHLTIKALDGRGNETSSGELSVEILSVEDYDRRLSQRQGSLLEELTILRRNQQKTKAAIKELEAAALGGAKPFDRGRDAQVDQGRVTNDLVQFVADMHDVFNSYVLSRVGAATTIEKLLPLYDEALAAPSDDTVFPASLYEKIVAGKRAERFFDSEVLGALLEILDLGQRGVSDVSPAVYRSLVAWSGQPAHDPADLSRAAKQSEDLSTLLYEIDQRMRRWGDLNLLIEMAREIRDIESTLSKDPAGTKGLRPK